MDILTKKQAFDADKTAVTRGTNELTLMKNAGFAAACVIARHFQKRPVFVMCGTGNNGGDGFVVAQTLLSWGYPVTVGIFGNQTSLSPSCAFYADRFDGDRVPLTVDAVDKALSQNALFVDAVFGIGLNRPLDACLTTALARISAARADVVAIDIPSGVNVDTGTLDPGTLCCVATITFCRPKPAHFLYPAKKHVGNLFVCDIGISDDDVAAQHPYLQTNDIPKSSLIPDKEAHKYTRGAVLVKGGDVMTGAARLCATAALHAGAGLVEIACSEKTFPIYTQTPEFVISTDAFETFCASSKIKAIAVGMGLGTSDASRTAVISAVASGKPVVLDADALRFITPDLCLTHAVLTPHAGEFARAFPELTNEPSKIQKALKAAKKTGAVVVLKGADTVIAAPDGRAAVNTETTPFLATAGSGDVLAGIIAAALANGLSPFDAAKTGVWRHAHALIDATAPFTAAELASASFCY